MKKPHFFVGGALTAAALFVLQSSCTFVLDDNVQQCNVTEDCLARGPAYVGYVCSPDKVCAKAGDYCDSNLQCIQANNGQPFVCNAGHRCEPGCADAADKTKTADQQCIDANGGKPFRCVSGQCVVGCLTDDQCVADKGAGFICSNTTNLCVEGCRTNRECIDRNGGRAFTCRKDTYQCAPLLNEPFCPQVLYVKEEDKYNDDTLYLGLVATQSGVSIAFGPPFIEAVQLANIEFNQGAGGNGLPLGKKRRPTALVNCDAVQDIVKSAKFLTDTVGVPAVLGPSSSSSYSAAGPSIFQPAKVVAIGGAAGAIDLGPLLAASNGYLYRTIPSDALQIQAIPPYVRLLETAVRAKYNLAPTDQIRVAVVSTTDTFGVSYSSYLNANLVFNGKSTTDNGDNYKPVSVGDTLKDPDTLQKQAAAAATLLAYKPHVVFFATRLEALEGLTLPIEQGWTDATFKPYYIYNSSIFNAGIPNFLNTKVTDPAMKESLRQRMSGATPSSLNRAQLDQYKLRHTQQWANFVWKALPIVPATGQPPVSTGPSLYSSAMYDATYTMLTAIVATGKEQPTGEDIAAAMKKTQPGDGRPVIDIGPSAVPNIIKSLTDGQAVDLNGVLSDINFDAENTVKTGTALWCVKAAVNGKFGPAVETSYRFSVDTKQFTGTAPVNGVFPECP